MLETQARIDPRVRRTRNMLQKAMTDLMHEKNFTNISVQDIANRADVNRATFYAHFVDKYDLGDALIREGFQSLLHNNLPLDSAFTRSNLRLLIQTVYTYLSAFPGQCGTANITSDLSRVVQQVQTQVYNTLLDWLQRCETGAKSSNTLEVTAMVTSWAIFGPILQAAWGKGKMTSEDLIEQLMPLVQSTVQAYIRRED